ncbi:AbfB domain-containing protein [Actinoplanes sp. NPDC049548]|uniref:AbfB domain-containing protein n=1 Tax=Actinoplanes sp. NPDC049548 TaxID=3155152 RepID=UPI0034472C4F
MSTEDEYRPHLRVGGWVPPPRPVSGAPAPLPESFLASAAVPVPELPLAPEPPAPSGHRTGIVAGAALAVLVVVGIAVLQVNHSTAAGPALFVAPSVAASPVRPPSASPAPSAPVVRRSFTERTRAAGPSGAASSAATPSGAASPSANPSTAAPQQRGPFTLGASVGLEPAGLPGFRVRHRDYRARVDRIGADSSALDRADSTFTVRAGLADGSCVSFESVNYPGHFLRHRDSRVWLDGRDGSALYAADATFCPVDGRHPGTVALRSQNYPDRYLSLRRSRLDLGRRQVSFTVRPPL